jgi:hypothetical protein
VVRRRALLLGGGATLLAAGCGKDERVAPPPAGAALLHSLAAERALGATIAALAPRADRALMRRLADRSRGRAGILAAAISAQGGRPHDAPAPEGGGDRDEALRRGRAALEAYVTALPSLSGREQRALGVDLVAQAAADVALLGDAIGSPPDDPFPGTPS